MSVAGVRGIGSGGERARGISRWLWRAAVAAGLIAVTVGTGQLKAAAAVPVTGPVPGELSLSPASGPVSTTPTWSTSTACPSGFQVSAVLDALNTDGSIVEAISPVVTGVTAPFSGTLLAGDTVASVLAASSVTGGETVEWVVACSAGGTSGSVLIQATEVTLSPDGSSYTTSCTGTEVFVCLLPPSGATSLTPSWVTTTPCPPDEQFSAAVYTLNANGSLGSAISPVIDDVGDPFSGTLLADVAQDFSGTGISDGQTDEWAVVCFGAGGSEDIIASVYVTLSSDGSSYTTSSSQPPLITTYTTLTASPEPAIGSTIVTLTATVTAADGTNPGGSVTFEDDGTAFGQGSVNADGVATTTLEVSPPGPYPLEAVLTPANVLNYGISIGTFTETFSANAGTVPLTVAVPSSGLLTVTVVNTAVSLTENSAGTAATGTLGNVTVTDTRNTYPGWSVSGQESSFTGSGTAAGFSVAGDQLGWLPTPVGSLAAGVLAGPRIAPGTSPGGLGDTGGVLISAAPGYGYGTSEANAALTLDIPAEQAAGSYAGSLTITYLSLGP